MYEIEAKVSLTASDLKRLKKELPDFAKFSQKHKVSDQYYPDFKKITIRLRTDGNKTFLNTKYRAVVRGIEENQELEWGIRKPSEFKKLLKKIDIPLTLHKEKDSEVYKKGNVRIEVNRLKGLGDYLEIELRAHDKKQIPKAQKKLQEVFRHFGFSPKQFEKRTYLQMLGEKAKKR